MSCLLSKKSLEEDERRFYLAFGECAAPFRPHLPHKATQENIDRDQKSYNNVNRYLASSTHISEWTDVTNQAPTLADITSVYSEYIRLTPKFQQCWKISGSSLTDHTLIQEAIKKKKAAS